jgi:hypothetical protein
MGRILITITILVASLLLATCERSDMFNLAMYGLPPKSAIYIYPVNQHAGNMGGRSEIDAICYNEGMTYHSSVKAGTVKGFISVSLIDDIRLLVPSQYWQYPVIGISPLMTTTVISNTWAGMLGGLLLSTFDTAVGIAGMNWWSGSYADGSFNATDNCSGWHSLDPAVFGQAGSTGFNGTPITCSTFNYLLCIAY